MSDVTGIDPNLTPLSTVDGPTSNLDGAPNSLVGSGSGGGGIDTQSVLGQSQAAAQDLVTLQTGLIAIQTAVSGNTSAYNSISAILEDAGNSSIR